MERVTGIGGIFFKARDAEGLKAWYSEHLGVEPGADGGVIFEWREADAPERKVIRSGRRFGMTPRISRRAKRPS